MYSQNIIEDLQDNGPTDPSQSNNYAQFNEEVLLKSKNRRILIITNKNQSLKQGDFISLYVNSEKIARALVAKDRNNKVAIKIINTFSDKFDRLTRRGDELEIIRGDDSSFSATEEDINADLGENDLFSIDLIDKKEEKENAKKLNERNLVTLGIGLYQGIDSQEESKAYVHGILSYAIKAFGPVWFEGVYGYSNLQRFPRQDTSAHLHGLGVRLKLNINLPAYMFLMPYAGIHFAYVSSTDTIDPGASAPQAEINAYNREVDLINIASQFRPTAGLTLHKRFVPGWFITLSGGLDVSYAGVTIGF